jgi:hypothetical protein
VGQNLHVYPKEVENVIGLKLVIFDAKVWIFKAVNSGFSFYVLLQQAFVFGLFLVATLTWKQI